MTTTTIRPNGLLAIFSVGVTGAANAQTALNDNTDASWVQASDQVNGGAVGLAMGTISAPGANQRILSCRPRIRCVATNFSFYQSKVGTKFYDSTNYSLGYTGLWSVSDRSIASTTDMNGPICYVAPGNVAWTKAKVDNLRTDVSWAPSPVFGAPVSLAKVFELYVDVAVNDQPIITGAPVATGTDTARPTVDWNYLDADGDAQSRYQVKAFTSAQYGGAMFDPETSAADYSSGEVFSSTSTAQMGADLQNGVTYKIYVKAAQEWPGPQGPAWYSAWSATAPFTLAYTPPVTPTLTVAALVDDNAVRAVLTIDAPENLLSGDSGSFEDGTLGNWVADTNVTLAVSSTDGADGIKSMDMASVAGGDMIARCEIDTLGEPRVLGGHTYAAVASFRTAVTARQCSVGVRWLDVAGGTISTVFGTSAADNTGGYTQVTFSGAAPGNAVQAKLVVKVAATGAAAEHHRVDKLMLRSGASTVFTPADYGTTQVVITERGERVDPSRGSAENWSHPQVHSGGSMFQTSDLGFKIDATKDLMQWEFLAKQILDENTPPGCVHWMPRTAAVSTFTFGSSMLIPETDYNFPVIIGSAHDVSCWAWCLSGTFTTKIKIEWLDQNGSVLSTTASANVTLNTTPQRLSLSGTAPALAAGARGLLSNESSSNSADVFITKIGWGLGALPLDARQPRGGPLIWSSIRTAIDTGPNGQPFGAKTFVDFESPPGRPVLFRSRSTSTPVGSVLSSANSTYATLLGPTPVQSILRSVSNPNLQVAVNRRKDTQYVRVADQQLFHPLGRSGDPVQVSDWSGAEDGQLILITSTEAQAARLRALIETPGPLLVQWAQGGHTYCVLTQRDTLEHLLNYNWCDVDGIPQTDLRVDVHTLAYIGTARPS